MFSSLVQLASRQDFVDDGPTLLHHRRLHDDHRSRCGCSTELYHILRAIHPDLTISIMRSVAIAVTCVHSTCVYTRRYLRVVNCSRRYIFSESSADVDAARWRGDGWVTACETHIKPKTTPLIQHVLRASVTVALYVPSLMIECVVDVRGNGCNSPLSSQLRAACSIDVPSPPEQLRNP
jgi:hypothetical protein